MKKLNCHSILSVEEKRSKYFESPFSLLVLFFLALLYTYSDLQAIAIVR